MTFRGFLFLDKIHEYAARYDNSVINFVEWWDAKSEKFSIVMPDGIKAVRVMSIHKSKGLEWPCVILADYQKDVKWSFIAREVFGVRIQNKDNINLDKILDDRTFSVSATAVRIPTAGGHSEAVNVEFINDFDVNDIRKLLHNTPGVTLQDNPDTNTYPMPIYAQNKDDVFVGRIRRDETQSNTLNLWIVSDNLRKGAATNAIQIAEYLMGQDLV